MAFDVKKEYKEFYMPKNKPDIVTEEVFRWAVNEATKKKKLDFSKVEFLTVEEGL